MPVITSASRSPGSRLGQAVIIGACLSLAVATAACSLGLFAVQRRAIDPPRFSVRLGHVEFAAPCPSAFQCDSGLPYYAVWRGDSQPNGAIHFRQLFFTWLPKKDQP